MQKISLICEPQNGNSSENKSAEGGTYASSLKKSSRISKHSFDNLNSFQNTPNMKMISKINSISSLNDKNLEKFSLGNNNNNRFLVTKSSYIETFVPGGSQQQQRNYNTMDSQMLSSAKSLKFNNNSSSDNSSASAAVFWDFTKPTLSSLPTTSNTNLRNTVSSSNLTLNVNYGDNNQSTNQMIPLVLPQKFQFNQPQAQPVMKQQASGSSGPPSSSSSSLAMGGVLHQQQQQQDDQLQQLLCSRKNSLPHSSNLINNNHTTTTTSTATISSNNELNVNGVNVSNRNNGKMCPQTTSSSATSNNVVNTSTSTAMNIATNVEQMQQHQNGNQNDGKSSSLKCPVVASPHQVMMLYMNKLTPYEHHEIYKYSEIYFIGANAKKRSGPNEYDNDNGSYIHIPHDHIAYRYEVLKIIGKGSFGQVVKAYDHKTREHVALKMVRNEKRFHRQAQEEIRILKHLRAQDKENTYNIIHM